MRVTNQHTAVAVTLSRTHAVYVGPGAREETAGVVDHSPVGRQRVRQRQEGPPYGQQRSSDERPSEARLVTPKDRASQWLLMPCFSSEGRAERVGGTMVLAA